MRKLSLLVCGIVLAGVVSSAQAAVSFSLLTSNGNSNVASQLSADVINLGPGQVGFKFTNNVGIASSITDIYFDDGTLLGISTISDSGGGVAFTAPATPGDLPGGNAANPDFEVTKGFSADSDSPVSQNGIDSASEWVQINFNLINSKTYADTLAALVTGELRIGLHVQAIGQTGGSDSYINNPGGGQEEVPEPTTLGIWAIGLACSAIARARYRRRQSA